MPYAPKVEATGNNNNNNEKYRIFWYSLVGKGKVVLLR
jgi:hypothetical protein